MNRPGRFRPLHRLLLSITLGLAFSGSIGAAKAADFYTLVSNGPASNRVCIVFLSEGYTTNQSATFLTHCSNALTYFFAEQPFTEYSNFFNAYAIFTNSAQSGSDHLGASNNTYFNSGYDAANDLLITIPAGTNGQDKVDALLTTHTPTNAYRYRLPVMLVNDSAQGGSGGVIAISSGFNTSLNGILTHEIGHVFAGLGDEYPASPGYIDANTFPAEPNTTQQTNRNLIPWKSWISTNTPVPTPAEDENYYFEVGLFEGAHYSPTNWYRPRLDCRMRSTTSGIAFCEVCREALVKTIHSKIWSVDSVSPTNASLTLTTTLAVAFSVTPLQPLTHNLSVQWQTNGVNVPGATNASFLFNPASVTNGTYTLRVIVHDDTAWVRDDPAALLFATNTWNLTVAVPTLWLESPQALADGQFRFTVRSSAVTNFTIKASTNLTGWASISTNAMSGGQFNFTNGGLTNIPWRFYRAVTPPQ